MHPGESRLFQVRVRTSSAIDRGYNVLVRAVDAESAAGSMRARGHDVIGVAEADREAVLALCGGEGRAAAITICFACKYPIYDLPGGEAGHLPVPASGKRPKRGMVICPECGAVNTGHETAALIRKRTSMRATAARWLLYFFVGVAVIASIVLVKAL